MNRILIGIIFILLALPFGASRNPHRTVVQIKGDQFYINGSPTYNSRYWHGLKIEGLLINSRMVQGIFDDMNAATAGKWKYPDTQKWDPERNTRDFIKSMKKWKSYGLLSFTINMQGGSPQGYSQAQPWYNSGYYEDGSLRPEYIKRLELILDEADRLGMVPILGLFYFGQDEHLKNERAVTNAVKNMINWLSDMGYTNVLIEIDNECNVKYDHEILKPERVHELIMMVKGMTRNGRRFYAGTSFGGGTVPTTEVIRQSDFILMHGNGVTRPSKILDMINSVRNNNSYQPKPILFNEDDHYDFDKEDNNFLEALKGYASWGFFDFRREGESYREGYQSVPVNWGISSERKKQFFNYVKQITGK